MRVRRGACSPGTAESLRLGYFVTRARAPCQCRRHVPWSCVHSSSSCRLRKPGSVTLKCVFLTVAVGMLCQGGLRSDLASSDGVACAALATDQRAALVDLYLATAGYGWSTATGWSDFANGTNDPCSTPAWFGLTCDERASDAL
jgi:hypothetical protein